MLYILQNQYIGTMLIIKLNFSEVAQELQFCSNSKNSGYFENYLLFSFPDFHFSLSPIELTENRLPRFPFHRRTWFSTLQFYSTPKEERKTIGASEWQMKNPLCCSRARKSVPKSNEKWQQTKTLRCVRLCVNQSETGLKPVLNQS